MSNRNISDYLGRVQRMHDEIGFRYRPEWFPRTVSEEDIHVLHEIWRGITPIRGWKVPDPNGKDKQAFIALRENPVVLGIELTILAFILSQIARRNLAERKCSKIYQT